MALFLVLLCILASVLPRIHAQSLQYAKRFPKSRLYNLSPESVGLGNIDGTISAFGDFNADKYTDLFVLGADQTTITVYTWNHRNFSFSSLPNGPHIQTKDAIVSVVPGDYNYDGHLDVLLMTQAAPAQSSTEIKLTVYLGNGNDSFNSTPVSLPSAKNALPMVVDLNGDMRLDILGYAWGTSESASLSAWINAGNQDNGISYNVTSADAYFDAKSLSSCRWTTPHSNAFIDLDGDCLADLVFVCSGDYGRNSVQIWTNKREKGFELAQTLTLPTNAGPLAFADMDGSGSVDMIFTTCDGHRCAVHTVYNQQMGLCAKLDTDQSNCRRSQQLCVADPNFRFDLSHPQSKDYTVYDMSPLLDQSEYVLTRDQAFRGYLPVPIHPGDYNLDGYPDLLLTTNKRALLLQSDLCTAETCSSDAVQANRRTFSLVSSGADSLSKISNPRHATFFDIDEDGSLDILVLQGSASSQTSARTPNFVINNYFNDAFFLKGLISNGAPPQDGSSAKPYGVNYPGGNFKFTVLDTSGTKRVHQVPQLSQASYMTLQTPYSLFGLGRTNNYIEEMFAGVTRHQQQNYLFYEGVIPNSQLVFLPFQPENVEDSSSWKVELYVQPADYIPWVLVSLIASSLILATVVAVLFWMERREDERERRKALHIINFDAL
ncbi:hypothetical protein BC940DRAFT_292890 [Gongronella butleri]|nr:hypothetical protein BC940DRAFT_292890 [Gongronella butleri]